jgi:hypothetical protein
MALTKDQLIAENAQLRQTIAEFGDVAGELARSRELNADLQQQVAILQQQVQASNRGGFDVLAKGWMNSAIGIRVNALPDIDQSNLLVGIIFGDFEIIRTAYGHILKRLADLGQPATESEQVEIQQLMAQAGFA